MTREGGSVGQRKLENTHHVFRPQSNTHSQNQTTIPPVVKTAGKVIAAVAIGGGLICFAFSVSTFIGAYGATAIASDVLVWSVFGMGSSTVVSAVGTFVIGRLFYNHNKKTPRTVTYKAAPRPVQPPVRSRDNGSGVYPSGTNNGNITPVHSDSEDPASSDKSDSHNSDGTGTPPPAGTPANNGNRPPVVILTNSGDESDSHNSDGAGTLYKAKSAPESLEHNSGSDSSKANEDTASHPARHNGMVSELEEQQEMDRSSDTEEAPFVKARDGSNLLDQDISSMKYIKDLQTAYQSKAYNTRYDRGVPQMIANNPLIRNRFIDEKNWQESDFKKICYTKQQLRDIESILGIEPQQQLINEANSNEDDFDKIKAEVEQAVQGLNEYQASDITALHTVTELYNCFTEMNVKDNSNRAILFIYNPLLKKALPTKLGIDVGSLRSVAPDKLTEAIEEILLEAMPSKNEKDEKPIDNTETPSAHTSQPDTATTTTSLTLKEKIQRLDNDGDLVRLYLECFTSSGPLQKTEFEKDPSLVLAFAQNPLISYELSSQYGLHPEALPSATDNLEMLHKFIREVLQIEKKSGSTEDLSRLETASDLYKQFVTEAVLLKPHLAERYINHPLLREELNEKYGNTLRSELGGPQPGELANFIQSILTSKIVDEEESSESTDSEGEEAVEKIQTGARMDKFDPVLRGLNKVETPQDLYRLLTDNQTLLLKDDAQVLLDQIASTEVFRTALETPNLSSGCRSELLSATSATAKYAAINRALEEKIKYDKSKEKEQTATATHRPPADPITQSEVAALRKEYHSVNNVPILTTFEVSTSDLEEFPNTTANLEIDFEVTEDLNQENESSTQNVEVMKGNFLSEYEAASSSTDTLKDLLVVLPKHHDFLIQNPKYLTRISELPLIELAKKSPIGQHMISKGSLSADLSTETPEKLFRDLLQLVKLALVNTSPTDSIPSASDSHDSSSPPMSGSDEPSSYSDNDDELEVESQQKTPWIAGNAKNENTQSNSLLGANHRRTRSAARSKDLSQDQQPNKLRDLQEDNKGYLNKLNEFPSDEPTAQSLIHLRQTHRDYLNKLDLSLPENISLFDSSSSSDNPAITNRVVILRALFKHKPFLLPAEVIAHLNSNKTTVLSHLSDVSAPTRQLIKNTLELKLKRPQTGKSNETPTPQELFDLYVAVQSKRQFKRRNQLQANPRSEGVKELLGGGQSSRSDRAELFSVANSLIGAEHRDQQELEEAAEPSDHSDSDHSDSDHSDTKGQPISNHPLLPDWNAKDITENSTATAKNSSLLNTVWQTGSLEAKKNNEQSAQVLQNQVNKAALSVPPPPTDSQPPAYPPRNGGWPPQNPIDYLPSLPSRSNDQSAQDLQNQVNDAASSVPPPPTNGQPPAINAPQTRPTSTIMDEMHEKLQKQREKIGSGASTIDERLDQAKRAREEEAKRQEKKDLAKLRATVNDSEGEEVEEVDESAAFEMTGSLLTQAQLNEPESHLFSTRQQAVRLVSSVELCKTPEEEAVAERMKDRQSGTIANIATDASVISISDLQQDLQAATNKGNASRSEFLSIFPEYKTMKHNGSTEEGRASMLKVRKLWSMYLTRKRFLSDKSCPDTALSTDDLKQIISNENVDSTNAKLADYQTKFREFRAKETKPKDTEIPEHILKSATGESLGLYATLKAGLKFKIPKPPESSSDSDDT